VAEPGNDPGNDFSVTMSADKHMRTPSSVPDGDHQLLSMPKGQDNVAPIPIQRIERFVTARLTLHRARDAANRSGCDRRQQRTLHPLCDTLLQANPTLSTH
jgi:hypothetical protein